MKRSKIVITNVAKVLRFIKELPCGLIEAVFWMREKRKQLLSESSKIVEITLLFGGEVVNEPNHNPSHNRSVSEPGAVATGSGGYFVTSVVDLGHTSSSVPAVRSTAPRSSPRSQVP